MKKKILIAACAFAAALSLMSSVLSAQVTDTTKKQSSTGVQTSTSPLIVAPARPAQSSRAISDSAIIAMLQVSATQEIAAAELAATKAQSDRVKRFAETLKTDHAKALQDLQTYAQRMGAGSTGMPSGMVRDSAMRAKDSTRSGRDNSAMSGRRDSSSIVGRDTAAVRDTSSTGRDPSAMAGQRDSSRMVQSELPPGKDSVGVRHDSVLVGRDSTLAGRRDTTMAGQIARDSMKPGRESGVTTPVTGQPGYPANKPGNEPEVTFENLQSLSGHEFDHGFIRLQVEHHQEEINHLRNDIIPMIKDSGLKSLVQRQLPTLGAHLREAQAIEAYLKTVN